MDGKAGKVLRITMKYLSQNMNIKYLVVDSIGHHVRTAAKKELKPAVHRAEVNSNRLSRVTWLSIH